jgi:cell division protein FtsL
MNRRAKPARPPSRWLSGLLVLAIVGVGFTTLMVRLEVTQEGYRLSSLKNEIAELDEHNRTLKLQTAELSSHQRLRSLAAKYQMSAPARGQVVVVQ